MYKITWDKATGGILLNLHVVEDTLSVSPRPVFYEELDLLKLSDDGWNYPHCEEPIMWACNKQYFYHGELLFEVSGANIYDAPKVAYAEGVTPGILKAVNVKSMLQKNKDPMFLIESEAIDFIRDTYLAYSAANIAFEKAPANQIVEELKERQEQKTKRKMAIVKQDCDSFDVMPLETAYELGKRVFQTTKIDYFLASFSGGKDSQVILDLCTRAIPPTAFQVIYSDTGYELPSSLNLYEDVKRFYGKRFPDLKFSTAANHAPVLDYWDKIGTPSDKQRWCCSVMKTGPLYRKLKVADSNKQGKVLCFEGVRAEESTRRSGYERIGRGVKHSTTVNARPIFMWNTTEVFLYIFKHNLPINPAYRRGMTRVGCLLCPFASEWNEMIANHTEPESVKPFLNRIEAFGRKAGVKDLQDYIREGGWKRRGGGNYIEKNSFIQFKALTPEFIAIFKNPRLPIESYLQILGDFRMSGSIENRKGELVVKKDVYEFTVVKERQNEEIYRFCIHNITDVELIGNIKRVLYKTTYCIQCEACEVECPTGALTVYPNISVDKKLCIHCHKCLSFHEKGCIVANSLSIAENMISKQGNIDRYKNFGLKEEWLEQYFIDLDDYWTSEHGLNENYQIPSLKAWLKDAGIIDQSCHVTPLGKLLAELRLDRPEIVWEIIWINLTYNSFIAGWFSRNIAHGTQYSQKLMEEMIRDQYPSYKEKTVHNAVYQIQRTLRESPIGSQINQMSVIDKETSLRGEYEDISEEAIAYSLYKYAEIHGVHSLRVSDFYQESCEGGPYREFGISKSVFEKALRTLNSASNRVLVAELNMGLDHINLREDLTSETALREMIQ